ncbi:MAG: ATP-binding protein [Ruminococcus sp.]|nr:ATP-binding protein [Ruminococcus sp.]
MNKLSVKADISYLDEVLSFTAECTEHLPAKLQNQLAIAVEEIFVNIAHYAYPRERTDGYADIIFDENNREIVITFIDGGIPYNPLEKTDPDVNLGFEEREIGGLGIFMVKKITDGMTYEYIGKKNVFTIKKLKNS